MDDTHDISGNNYYKASLELMVQNIAETRALTTLILGTLSNNKQEAMTNLRSLLKDEIDRQKKDLYENLYAEYGYLPPDILGEED